MDPLDGMHVLTVLQCDFKPAQHGLGSQSCLCYRCLTCICTLFNADLGQRPEFLTVTDRLSLSEMWIAAAVSF